MVYLWNNDVSFERIPQSSGLMYYQAAHLPCTDPLTDGVTWLYPSSTKTLQEVGLYPMTTYLSRRRGYLLAYARSCCERFVACCADTSTRDLNKYWWGLYGRDIEGQQPPTVAT
jgi:hypothetical protein